MKPAKAMLDAEYICPFCREGDFDAIGLKRHLLAGWCNAFEATPEHRATLTLSPTKKARRNDR